MAGQLQADLGSNATEAWCWMSKADPQWVLRAKHQDLASGKAKFLGPGDAAWFLQVLGVGEYGPPQRYAVAERHGLLELVQKTKEPDGSRLRHSPWCSARANPTSRWHTVWRTSRARCCAGCRIPERSKDPDTGALLPKKLTFEWPPHKTKMQLDLFDARVVPSLDPEKAKRYFTPPDIP